MKAKLLKNHTPDCHAVNAVERGNWTTPWYLDTWQGPEVLRRSSVCDKRGDFYRWVVFNCNARNCSATLAVLVSKIEELAEQLLSASADPVLEKTGEDADE